MKRLIPVIHLIDEKQMIHNIETCLEADVNHVFIISHLNDHKFLIKHALLARSKYPELWIGVNFLDLSPFEVLQQDLPFNAVWFDETLSLDEVENKKYNGEIFSGINFKYQPQFKGLALEYSAKLIKETSSVACTSGNGTGLPADIRKIKVLKEMLGDFPLALASGVSSDNVQSYLPYVDNFLVASSIIDSNELIRLESLKELKNKIYV